LDTFDEARYTDPTLLELVSRITVRHDTAMDARYPEGIPNRITLYLKDGRTLTEENTFPRGHARNPMSDEEVEAKFYVLTEWALPRARQDEVLQFVWNLDAQPTLAPLMELLQVE
jgi:2-methylcitrate dehydratase